MRRKGREGRLGRRLEEVAKAVGGGYCRLQMPLRLALAVRKTVAGHRLGASQRGGGGGYPPPPSSNASLLGTHPTEQGLWGLWGSERNTPPHPLPPSPHPSHPHSPASHAGAPPIEANAEAAAALLSAQVPKWAGPCPQGRGASGGRALCNPPGSALPPPPLMACLGLLLGMQGYGGSHSGGGQWPGHGTGVWRARWACTACVHRGGGGA